MADLLLLYPTAPPQTIILTQWLSTYEADIFPLNTTPAKLFRPPKLLPIINLPTLNYPYIILVYYKTKHSFSPNSPLSNLINLMASQLNTSTRCALIELTKSKDINEIIPSEIVKSFQQVPAFFSLPLNECCEGSLSRVSFMQFIEEFLSH